MDFDEVIDELSVFNIKFADERAFEVFSFLASSKRLSLTDAVDAMVAHSANAKTTTMTSALVQECFERLPESENVVPSPATVKREPRTPITPAIVKTEVSVDPEAPLKTLQTVDLSVTLPVIAEDSWAAFDFTEQSFEPGDIAAGSMGDGFDHHDLAGSDECTLTGRIFAPLSSAADGATTFYLLSPEDNYTIDLADTQQAVIFDQDLVTVTGYESDKKRFKAITVHEPSASGLSPISTRVPSTLLAHCSVLTVSGPFNSSAGNGLFPDRLAAVFANAKETGARLLILLGPVVDLSSIGPAALSLEDVSDAFFSELVSQVDAFSLSGSPLTVVVVPGTESDILVSTPAIPTLRYPGTDQWTLSSLAEHGIHCLPNPGLFAFGGLTFAVTTADVVSSLCRVGRLLTTPSIPAGTTRVQWLVGELLKRRRIVPPFDPAFADGGVLPDGLLPNVFVMPSKLKRFAAVNEGVAVVNVGRNGCCLLKATDCVVPADAGAAIVDFRVQFLGQK